MENNFHKFSKNIHNITTNIKRIINFYHVYMAKAVIVQFIPRVEKASYKIASF